MLFLALNGSTGYLWSQLYTAERTNTYLQERIKHYDSTYTKCVTTLEHRVNIWQDHYFQLEAQRQEWRDKERNLDMQLLTTILENRHIQDELAFYKEQYQQALQLKQQFKDIKQAMDEEELLFLQVYHKQREDIRTTKLELRHSFRQQYADTIQNYWKKTYGVEKPYEELSFLEDYLFCDAALYKDPQKFDSICQYLNRFNQTFPGLLSKILATGINLQFSGKSYLSNDEEWYTVWYQTWDSITVCYDYFTTAFGHEIDHALDQDAQYSWTPAFQKIYQQYRDDTTCWLSEYHRSTSSEFFAELFNLWMIRFMETGDDEKFIKQYGKETADYLQWVYSDFNAKPPKHHEGP